MTKPDLQAFIEQIDHAINAALGSEQIGADDLELVLQKRSQDMREVHAAEQQPEE